MAIGTFAVAAVVTWVLTASIGAYMLRAWVARGGLRRQRATGAGVPPAVVFGHASVALTGLLIWICFLATRWDPLAWAGVAFIGAAIALGICTVTLWTPYPVVVPAVAGGPGAAPPGGGPAAPAGGGPAAPADAFTVTDEMIASLLTEPFPARSRPRLRLVPLVPAVHGVAALTTFMLAVLAAIGMLLGTFRCQ